MGEELLREKGLEPEGGEIAAIDGFALRIGQRAALVPAPGAKVYGLVFSLTRSELDRLYSESSVQAYKPQAVFAQLASGGVVAALCYNLRQPPSPRKRRPRSQKTVPSTRFIPQIQSDFGPRSRTGGAKSISPSNHGFTVCWSVDITSVRCPGCSDRMWLATSSPATRSPWRALSTPGMNRTPSPSVIRIAAATASHSSTGRRFTVRNLDAAARLCPPVRAGTALS